MAVINLDLIDSFSMVKNTPQPVGNTLTIFASTQSACAQMHFCCTNNRFHLYVYESIRVRNLLGGFSQKRGVYELIGQVPDF